MHQHGERIDRVAVDQHLQFHQVGRLVVGEVIVERGIATRHRLQAIVEIEHHFVERQVVFHHGAVAHIGELFLLAAAVLTELEHRAEIFVRREDRGLDPWFLHFFNMVRLRHVDRIVDLELLAGGELDLVDDRRRGRDQIEIELARQPLLDDLQVQQSEKAATETETERGRSLHFVSEAGVVKAQPCPWPRASPRTARRRPGTGRRTRPGLPGGSRAGVPPPDCDRR